MLMRSVFIWWEMLLQNMELAVIQETECRQLHRLACEQCMIKDGWPVVYPKCLFSIAVDSSGIMSFSFECWAWFKGPVFWQHNKDTWALLLLSFNMYTLGILRPVFKYMELLWRHCPCYKIYYTRVLHQISYILLNVPL